ncbi:hypothetical protein AK812_SmicGene26691 [Symbiodinium microadriaticum]|uniref:Uncharacterized protein n=1 Tax=Symbiodinium microadriaticum TaxID=2951 RepID=A0A1Q9D8T0_SYMMI|nr:hypothetical protein AK812_SmicGene26691 [Symbiodinium microadriaticum]
MGASPSVSIVEKASSSVVALAQVAPLLNLNISSQMNRGSTFPSPGGLPIPPLTSSCFYSPNGSYLMTMLRLGHSVGPKVLVRTDFWLLLALHLVAFAAYNSGFMGEKGGGWRLGLQELEWSDVELMFVLMSCALCFAVNQAYFRYLQLGQLVRKTMDSVYDFAFEARLFLRMENEPYDRLGCRWAVGSLILVLCEIRRSYTDGTIQQNDLLKLVDLEFIRPGEADFLDPHSLSARQRTLVMMHTACDCALHGLGKAEVAPATQRDLLQRLVDCKSYQLQLLDAANAMLPFEYFHLLSTLVILTTAYLGLCVGLCDSWIVPPAYATSLLIILGLFELLSSLNYPFDGLHETEYRVTRETFLMSDVDSTARKVFAVSVLTRLTSLMVPVVLSLVHQWQQILFMDKQNHVSFHV